MKYIKGDKVEVVGNLAGHNQIGLRAAVAGYAGKVVRLEDSQFNFYEADLKLLAIPKSQVLDRCQKAKSQYHLWQAKADYVEETHADELNDNDFQKYALKRLVENYHLSADDKVSMIQAIFSEQR